MPISQVGGRATYQIPAVNEFRISGGDRDHLSPDTLKVIEAESRVIIDKSGDSELKQAGTSGDERQKIVTYLKAVVARMKQEGVTDFTAPGRRKEKFVDTFHTKFSEVLEGVEAQPAKVTNGAFKNMLEAMVDFHRHIELSRTMAKKGLPYKSMDSIWDRSWRKKMEKLNPEFRPKPPTRMLGESEKPPAPPPKSPQTRGKSEKPVPPPKPSHPRSKPIPPQSRPN